MKEFFPHAIVRDARKIQDLATFIKTSDKPRAHIPAGTCEKMVSAFQRIADSCGDWLPLSKQSCEEIIQICSQADVRLPKASEVQALFVELNKRIEVELKAHTYLCIPKANSDFYKDPLKDWQTTIEAFPKATYDIEEAGKCLAFGAIPHVSFI